MFQFGFPVSQDDLPDVIDEFSRIKSFVTNRENHDLSDAMANSMIERLEVIIQKLEEVRGDMEAEIDIG